MFKSEYNLLRVWGIPIKIHISMIILLIYLAMQAIGEGESLLETIIGVVIILSAGILLFTSVALHELGHSFVAIRKGCRVHEITLMFMGGAAKMDRMPSRPMDEFLMAIAGPAVSLVLGIVGIFCATLLQKLGGIAAVIGVILLIVGKINIVLAVFNLIPAFPMDGGRVFRALLSPKYGRLKATYIASRLGRAIAIAFFFVGIFGLSTILPPHNLVLIIIAFFVFTTADREYRMVQYEELMKQRTQGFSNPFGAPPPPPPPPRTNPNDDSVYISPPPYADGPAAKTKLQHEEDNENPLKRFFGK